ncbi:MAG: family intrarane metalloprotease [Marmoricola sp.]|nr:family intrarane metalloprotease [Marmoricola sp.]
MTVVAAVRRWPSRLSGWLTAHEVERTGRTGPTGALLRVACVYVIGFALPIYAAIRYLTSAHIRALAHTATGWSIQSIIVLTLTAVAAVIAVAFLAIEAPSWSKPRVPGARWSAELKAFGLGWCATLAGSIASDLLGIGAYPRSHAAASAWPSAAGALFAGPVEEIVVLVVPLVFLRAAKWPWWQVIIAGLVLRLAYHVYCGFPAAGLTVWAVAMIFIYLRFHAILGLILAHSYWDMTGTVGVYWSSAVAGLMFLAPVLGLIIWGIVAVIRRLIRRYHRNQTALMAAATPIGWHQNSAGYWWWWDGQTWIAPPPAPAADAEP